LQIFSLKQKLSKLTSFGDDIGVPLCVPL